MEKEEILRKANTKILIADDDFLLRSLMEAVLLSSGYTCVCVEDGIAALDLLEQDTFDMVISDIEMPKLNGLELLSRIKKRYPAIKILIISGRHRPDDTIDGLSAKDAHSFLTKPFPLHLFLSTVDTVLLSSAYPVG